MTPKYSLDTHTPTGYVCEAQGGLHGKYLSK
jgi:hypothetical protein